MKKIIVFVSAVFLLSSCKKEFTCDNGQTFKRGSKEYSTIMKNGTFTDLNGQEVHCF